MSIKTPDQIAKMRVAGRVVAQTLQAVAESAKPGVSLIELDAVAAECIRDNNATSSFLHYQPQLAPSPYPGVVCLSVNDIIVHGVPNDYVLEDGDILSIDGGAIVDGWHGDGAITIGVGDIDDRARHLIDATRSALDAAIATCVPGGHLADIGAAVTRVADAHGFGVLADHGGHGIGNAMHESPWVANYGVEGDGPELVVGTVLALEPMFIESGDESYMLMDDGWSIATADDSRAAHWEHTVAVTADGPQVLTVL